MFANLTPTEVAYAMTVLMQAVVAVLWWVGGRVIGDVGNAQRVTTHWAVSGAFGALSFVAYLVAWRVPAVPHGSGARIVANLFSVLWLMTLQRGVWLFMKQPIRYRGHCLALALMVPGTWFGLFDEYSALRIEIYTAVLTGLGAALALDIHACARDHLQMRRPALLTVPIWVFCALMAARGFQAAFASEAAIGEMIGQSAQNVRTALIYVLMLLPFNGILLTLVVSRLRENMERLSHHDALTGLLNRRALEENLAAQLQRSRRNGQRFCVLMLDVDHFKRINDRFGHAVGDAALKHLATKLLGRLRKVDRLARFGGEEFVVLLPGLVLSDAMQVGERLRALVAGSPLPNAAAEIPLAVSIGVAEWSGALEDSSRLLVRADAALYQAKHQGRNQVVMASADALIAA